MAGSLLSIKPVIAIQRGEVAILGKARGSKQGNNLLAEQIRQAGESTLRSLSSWDIQGSATVRCRSILQTMKRSGKDSWMSWRPQAWGHHRNPHRPRCHRCGILLTCRIRSRSDGVLAAQGAECRGKLAKGAGSRGNVSQRSRNSEIWGFRSREAGRWVCLERVAGESERHGNEREEDGHEV